MCMNHNQTISPSKRNIWVVPFFFCPEDTGIWAGKPLATRKSDLVNGEGLASTAYSYRSAVDRSDDGNSAGTVFSLRPSDHVPIRIGTARSTGRALLSGYIREDCVDPGGNSCGSREYTKMHWDGWVTGYTDGHMTMYPDPGLAPGCALEGPYYTLTWGTMGVSFDQ